MKRKLTYMNYHKFADDYYSGLLDVDISGIRPGTIKVVASDRRLKREISFGFIHAVWIMLLNDDRAAVSAHPAAAAELEKLFSSVNDCSVIREEAFREKILNICREKIPGVSLSMGPGGPKYICLPDDFKNMLDPNVREITDKDKEEIWERLSEGGLYNLDSAIARKVAFAYYLDNKPVSFCLVHEINSEKIDNIGGIFTLEEYRGKGLAKAVLSAATAKIFKLGRIAIYGTSQANIASRNTAESVGYTNYAHQMSVTQKI